MWTSGVCVPKGPLNIYAIKKSCVIKRGGRAIAPILPPPSPPRSATATVCKMYAWRSFFRDLSTFIDRIAEGEHRTTANVAESVVSRISYYQPVAILQSRKCDACVHPDHVMSRAESARCHVRFSDRSFLYHRQVFGPFSLSIYFLNRQWVTLIVFTIDQSVFWSMVISIDCPEFAPYLCGFDPVWSFEPVSRVSTWLQTRARDTLWEAKT